MRKTIYYIILLYIINYTWLYYIILPARYSLYFVYKLFQLDLFIFLRYKSVWILRKITHITHKRFYLHSKIIIVKYFSSILQ